MKTADKNPEITTALTVDSICFIAGVIDSGIENQIIALVERQDLQSRKDERENGIKEIESNGEFISLLAASRYCRFHGLDLNTIESNTFRIAGALRDVKKSERQKIANEVKNLEISDITTAETLYNAILEGGK